MASFSIVKAGWRDLGDLRQLEHECFDQEAWPLLDLISALTLPGLVRLKAVAGDRMAGFVGGDPHPHEQLGWITTLGVSQAFRRQGIATALLLACEEQMQMPKVRLCVRKSNQPAIELYLREGYKTVDLWRAYYQSGEDALVLEKKRLAE